jgi:CheY-like chemotaxis protein
MAPQIPTFEEAKYDPDGRMRFKNLLLIDDDEDDQELFMEAAREISKDINITVVPDAAIALDRLVKKTVIADVIFSDLNMPRMNGQQFLLEIKRRPELKHIPVIIFSTSSHAHTIQLVKDFGAYEFITKPGLFNELVSTLRRLLT